MERRREVERISAEVKAQDEKVTNAIRKQREMKKRHREEMREMEREVQLEYDAKLLMEGELRNSRSHVSGRGGYRMKCGLTGCMGYVNMECKCAVCGRETCDSCWKVKDEMVEGSGDLHVSVKTSLTWVGRLANRSASLGVMRKYEDTPWVKVRLTIGAEHRCDEADVSTVALIKSTARQCPNCGVSISRIDGCDQMHCVACRHTFSWTSGAAEVGHIHNPEHFRMERDGRRGFMERDIRDVPCGGLPTRNELVFALSGQTGDMVEYWWNVVRVAESVVSISASQYMITACDSDYTNMHVDVVMGNLSMEKFRRRVRQRVEDRVVKDKVRPILSTWVQCVQDMTTRLMTEGRSVGRMMIRHDGRYVSRRVQLDDELKRSELMAMVEAANKELANISVYHGRRVPVIPTNYIRVDYPLVQMMRYVSV